MKEKFQTNNHLDPFVGISISEGDQIRMSVMATSTTSGSAVLQNLTTGQEVYQSFSNVTAGLFCQTYAGFIVEDFIYCDSNGNNCGPIPFASFSPAINFVDCTAIANGESIALSSAALLTLTVNNEDMTTCSISGSTLTCSYN
jgi:hypothetical protein